MEWRDISTCPEGIEVMTCIIGDDGPRMEQSLIKITREPGKTRPMFWTPNMSMYVYYTPTHWAEVQP